MCDLVCLSLTCLSHAQNISGHAEAVQDDILSEWVPRGGYTFLHPLLILAAYKLGSPEYLEKTVCLLVKGLSLGYTKVSTSTVTGYRHCSQKG